MRLHLRIMLENEQGEAFMGIGLLRLLETIDKEHSISRAARAMGLSYVKALRILDRLERNLRRKVVRRRKGGAKHGGAELTPEGRRLLDSFRGLCDHMQRTADRNFQTFQSQLRSRCKKA